MSDILVACTHDDDFLWVSQVIKIDRSDENPIIPKIYRAGKSYTISKKLYNSLSSHEYLEFIDSKSITKPVSSVQHLFRESNRGADLGGYFIMHDWIDK
jgi:hypothetical protein